MAGPASRLTPALKEIFMRYAPAAVALSLVVAITASAGVSAERQPDPRAAALLSEGRSELAAGQIAPATDSFEAALAVDPGYTAIYLALGDAARSQGLQGKAIRYYREALTRDPKNLAAISGEGKAMVEKGAIEKAKRNLAELKSLCGASCNEAQQLAMAIQNHPVLTADAAVPPAGVTHN
jgi:tetratricopeptide (TPR) repeat protein